MLAKMKNGSYQEMDIDIKSPNPEHLKDVEEIYVISKVLVPVLTLRAKNEIDRIDTIEDSQNTEQKEKHRKEK